MKKVLIYTFIAVFIVSLLVVGTGCKGTAVSSDTDDAANVGTQKILSLLCWEGYAEPEWKDSFEKENNCKVQTTYLGSDDEVYAKLKAGGGQVYNLVSTGIASAKALYKSGIVIALDESKITEYPNLFEKFKGDFSKVDGNLVSVPLDWGTLPMEINLDEVKEPYDSWGVLWDEQYKGKIAMMDDPIASITTTAIYLGIKDPYNLTDADFEKIKEALLKQKPLVRLYTSGFGEANDAFISGEIVAAASLGEYLHAKLIEAKLNVKQVVPKEGAVIWSDSWAIVKDSPNQDLAYKWIDKVLTLDTQKVICEKLGYGGVNKGLPAVLPDNIKEALNMFDEKSVEQYFSKLISMGYPESYDKRTALWNEIKASQ